MRDPLRIISLGAGVQSSTMALMASRGEIEGPKPDFAIFADTGWEPRATYDFLEYLEPLLTFPLIRVSAGNLRADLLAKRAARAGRFVTVPFFLRTETGPGRYRDGIGRRQCTSHYKIEPIQRKIRELLGAQPRQRIGHGAAESWVGISVDEIIRATPSKVRYITKRFPLLEAKMSRGDCVRWLEERQYRVPPKSACLGCPPFRRGMAGHQRQTRGMGGYAADRSRDPRRRSGAGAAASSAAIHAPAMRPSRSGRSIDGRGSRAAQYVRP